VIPDLKDPVALSEVTGSEIEISKRGDLCIEIFSCEFKCDF